MLRKIHAADEDQVEFDVRAEMTNTRSRLYRLTSKKPLDSYRGLDFNGKVSKIGANGFENKREGWFKYYATAAAFEHVCQSNNVVLIVIYD